MIEFEYEEVNVKDFRQTQLRALEQSIEKWKKVVFEGKEEKGRYDCECCMVFDDCFNCPIHEYTGRPGCYNTPYIKWVTVFLKSNFEPIPKVAVTVKEKALANHELSFLYEVRYWLICKMCRGE